MNILRRTQVSLRRVTQQLRRSLSEKMMMVQRKELTFRIAESQDFEEIVKMSEGHYKGYDYLPFVFHDWLEMDNLDIMLAHLGERLVGLRACFIVDDGETFVRRGGRTVPDLRGRNVNRELNRALQDYVRGKFPKVSRQRLLTISPFNSRNPWRQILEHNVLSYDVAEKPFRAGIPSKENELAMERYTKEFFSKSILFSPGTNRLLPNSILIVDCCPYQTFRSNIDYILREHDVHFFAEKRPIGAEPVSFSHGVHARRVKGVEWLATVYTDDSDLFEAHLLSQFKHACGLIKEQFTITVLVQQGNQAACARRVLGGILELKENSYIYENNTMKLYEIDFNYCTT